jgi:RNA polymerase sigma factor (sigma-70 family)
MILGVRKYSDEELVLIYAQKPSRDILQVIFERYGHLVLGLCMKYLRQMENAEDLCAAVFEKLPTLLIKHEINNFKSWLYRVVKNECLMLLRKKKSYTIQIDDAHIEAEQINDPEQREKEIRLLETALLELNTTQRECISLFYLQELSYQEISLQTGLEIKKVKSHIQNGKRNLKIKLEGNHE